MFDNKINLPNSIIIRDYQGREIKRITDPNTYELSVDLKNFDNGMYIINDNYFKETISRKIIKN